MSLPWNDPIPGTSALPVGLTGAWATAEHDPRGAGQINTWTGIASGEEPLVAAIVVEVGGRVGWTRSRFGPAPTTVGLSFRRFEPAPNWRQTWGSWFNGHVSRLPTDRGAQDASIHVTLPRANESYEAEIVLPSSTSTGVLAPWVVVRGDRAVCRFGIVLLLKRDVAVFRKRIWRPKSHVLGPLAEVFRGQSAGWMEDERGSPSE
jgi:hypothetical protein